MDFNKPILFVHSGHELYGADKMLVLNIRTIKNKYPNVEIEVVLPKKGPLSAFLLSEFDLKIHIRRMGIIRKYNLKRLNFSFIERIFTCFRLVRFLNSYSLVFINTIVIIDYIIASRFIKSNVIIHVHELPVGIASNVFSKLLKFSKAHLIFISYASKNSFSGINNLNQRVIWNGVRQVRKNDIKKENPHKINLLFIGRLNTWKGQTLLVQAINRLENSAIEVISVRIVGDVYRNQEQLKTQLEECIRDFNLQDIIEILPFTQNPDEHYNWADIVIVPSLLPEPFGLVAIEAMSVGKLVVAANHGGLTEIVSDGITGILFNPGSVLDLAEKISFAIGNIDTVKQMGENGFERYKNNFTEAVYMENLLKTF